MASPLYHLAQINVARMLGPLDSPIMAAFAAQVPTINALADQSEGFVWRLKDAADVRPDENDPLVLINMSVWQSIETLKNFTYKSHHLAPLRERERWFERPREAHLALWWIPAGHVPTVTEALDRLAHRRKFGDSSVAFSFAKPFPPPEEPAVLLPSPALQTDGKALPAAAAE